MELSSLSEHIVEVPYKRSGETVLLQINIDAFTPEFFRQVGETFKSRILEWQKEDKKESKKRKPKEDDALTKTHNFFENSARGLEIEREIHARLLSSGVLKGWDVTENGLPLAPSYEVLVKMPPPLIKGLWETSLRAAETVKKREDEETEVISDSMLNGSRAPLALAPTG